MKLLLMQSITVLNECIVIEVSKIGFQSATSAGLKTVITLNEYTNTKNFKGALVVIDHLGEDDQPFQIINVTPTTQIGKRRLYKGAL